MKTIRDVLNKICEECQQNCDGAMCGKCGALDDAMSDIRGIIKAVLEKHVDWDDIIGYME
jgi:Zn-dependent metalloprotease